MSDDRQGRAKRTAVRPVASEAVNDPATPPLPAPSAAPERPRPETMPELPAPEALPAPVAAAPQAGASSLVSAYQETLASLGRTQAAMVSDMAAAALEVGSQARSNLTAAGDSATALLKARSLGDAVEIQFGFARRSLDAMVASSTRLGEIGLRLANEAAKPVFGRFTG